MRRKKVMKKEEEEKDKWKEVTMVHKMEEKLKEK